MYCSAITIPSRATLWHCVGNGPASPDDDVPVPLLLPPGAVGPLDPPEDVVPHRDVAPLDELPPEDVDAPERDPPAALGGTSTFESPDNARRRSVSMPHAAASAIAPMPV